MFSQTLINRARELGASEIGPSWRAGKRFYVIYRDASGATRVIHFGSAVGKTFIDHGDEKKRRAWWARHSKIMRQGAPAVDQPESPDYWAARLLW